MISRLASALARFARGERGSFTVETVIIFPLLVWAYTAMFVFWDAFKTQNVNLKASYTIADMISREQRLIDQDYLDGARSIFAFLSPGTENQRIRVTVVTRRINSDGDEYLDLSWSQVSGDVTAYSDIDGLEQIIPLMGVGDQAIIVNTFTDWSPLFNVGLPALTLSETVVTSPRFAAQVLWDAGGT